MYTGGQLRVLSALNNTGITGQRVVDRGTSTSNRRHLQVARCVLFVLFYCVAANVPFWVASHSLGLIQNGCFDPSYALAGILVLFLPRIPAAMFLLFAILVDVVTSVCLTFYLSLSECLINFRVLQGISRAGHSAIVTILGLTLLIVIASSSLPAAKIVGIARRRTVAALSVMMVFFMSVDVVYANIVSIARGSGHLAHPFQLTAEQGDGMAFDGGPPKLRLARPSGLRLIRNEIGAMKFRRQYLKGSLQVASPVPSATIRALHYAGITADRSSKEMPNVALVLLESWGQSSDPAVRDALLEPYFQTGLLARYQVLQGICPSSQPSQAKGGSCAVATSGSL